VFGEALLERNMELFLRGVGRHLAWEPDDVVLDVGCGPGLLARGLRGRVRAVHSADVDERALERCRAVNAGDPVVRCHLLDAERPVAFPFLATGSCTKAIALSVVQYYPALADLEALVAEARRVLRPGGALLVADLPDAGGGRELGPFLGTALREGYAGIALRFLLRARFSEYHRLRTAAGLLAPSDEDLAELARAHGGQARLFRDALTVNPGRRHWLVRFGG
jgi:SAM-dependent methyltransferase